MYGHQAKRRRGFTLVELLAVVAIIGVLMGLLIPALAGVRGSARLGNEQAAARQMFIAYQNYTVGNRDQVMPGFLYGLQARDENGRLIEDEAESVVAARYPWRLAPYLDYNVEAMFVNDARETVERLEAGGGYAEYLYGVSLLPSLGLNATWLGGHQNQFSTNPDFLDQYGRFYLTSLHEAQNPEMLLVFASARSDAALPSAEDGWVGLYEGHHEVRGPYLTASGGNTWTTEYHDVATPGQYGFLSCRHGGEAVTVFVDGHVDALNPDQLRDMRHWAPRADREDWALE